MLAFGSEFALYTIVSVGLPCHIRGGLIGVNEQPSPLDNVFLIVLHIDTVVYRKIEW